MRRWIQYGDDYGDDYGESECWWCRVGIWSIEEELSDDGVECDELEDSECKREAHPKERERECCHPPASVRSSSAKTIVPEKNEKVEVVNVKVPSPLKSTQTQGSGARSSALRALRRRLHFKYWAKLWAGSTRRSRTQLARSRARASRSRWGVC